MTFKSNLSLAASAAMFALSAGAGATAHAQTAAPVAATADSVHCYGVNSCKGTSDCKSYGHDCKGQNDCKGQGFKVMSTAACTAAGGHLTEK